MSKLVEFKNKRGDKVHLHEQLTIKDLVQLGIKVRIVTPGKPVKQNEDVHTPKASHQGS